MISFYETKDTAPNRLTWISHFTLLKLIHWIAGNGIRIFLTSRPHLQDIENSLNPANSGYGIVIMNLNAKGQDVWVYVETSIEDDSTARDLIKGGLRDEVLTTLVKKCEGM